MWRLRPRDPLPDKPNSSVGLIGDIGPRLAGCVGAPAQDPDALAIVERSDHLPIKPAHVERSAGWVGDVPRPAAATGAASASDATTSSEASPDKAYLIVQRGCVIRATSSTAFGSKICYTGLRRCNRGSALARRPVAA
jgi:hypothetical protein